MLDRRYPEFQPVEHASALCDVERERAKSIADEVCRRTGTKCAWNAKTFSLHFYYGAVDVPAFAFPFMIDHKGVMPVNQSDIEDMVKLIRLGQLPREEKEEIAEQNRARQEYENAKEKERLHADVRPDAQGYADFLLRKRRGVARVISA